MISLFSFRFYATLTPDHPWGWILLLSDLYDCSLYQPWFHYSRLGSIPPWSSLRLDITTLRFVWLFSVPAMISLFSFRFYTILIIPEVGYYILLSDLYDCSLYQPWFHYSRLGSIPSWSSLRLDITALRSLWLFSIPAMNFSPCCSVSMLILRMRTGHCQSDSPLIQHATIQMPL